MGSNGWHTGIFQTRLPWNYGIAAPIPCLVGQEEHVEHVEHVELHD